MEKRILIDAAHSEETRLVLCKDGTIEALDHQNVAHRSKKGNVYLAKVIRIEPSLQAIFVDYGENRHGFLPFSEVHPDYYQLPHADKEELKNKLLEHERAYRNLDAGEIVQKEEEIAEGFESPDLEDSDTKEELEELAKAREAAQMGAEKFGGKQGEDREEKPASLELHTQYKVQEVIKKDQVLLVQVVKEERGNKGAALTTYLTLAGRYCVMLPNSSNSSGVSRKVDDEQERTRLRNVIKELQEQTLGSSLIIRTAGAYKTKTEIKRDYAYLKRLWGKIRDNTLSAKAPAFIYEEGDVIKRAIRDLYDSEVEEVLVSGELAYQECREFMKLILPRHVDKVRLHSGKLPLFAKFNIESQIAALYDSTVVLKSKGYIVINQAEALTAIDINSGKSTSEKNIESTALKTNLEAAEEIARQIRLRDLSGLIVIDFIDMLDVANRKSVEKSLRDALALDKAKIQIGRISEFGLLEMSRQRLGHSFLESNTQICDSCHGKGRVRPVPSTAVALLRAIENEIANSKFQEMEVSGRQELVFYILNHKRRELVELEKIANAKIIFNIDSEAGADSFYIEKRKEAKESATGALSVTDAGPYVLNEEEFKEPPKDQKRKEQGSNSTRKAKKEPQTNVEKSPKPSSKKKGRTKRYKIKGSTEPKSQNKAPKASQKKSLLKQIWSKLST